MVNSRGPVRGARGFEIVAPAFDELMRDAHRGKFDVVLVWSLDRLHRSMVGALQTVIEFDRMRVGVISVKEPWLDTGGPATGEQQQK